jgi:hypothetical protein
MQQYLVFFTSPITETQVLNIFLGLDSNKVSVDILNMIKIAAYELSPIFTNVFNESISTGVVPDILKISRITPIYKSGDTNEPHNYRPISILSVFSKVLVRLVYNQLDNFLEKHNIMYNYQFGFRKKHSTEQAILQPCKPGSLLPLPSLTGSSRDLGSGWSRDTLTRFVPCEGRLKYVKCKEQVSRSVYFEYRILDRSKCMIYFSCLDFCTVKCVTGIYSITFKALDQEPDKNNPL